MSWNYRVIEENGQLHIGDVYYDDTGKPIATHEKPSHVYGETLEDLEAMLDLFQKALNEPILSTKDIGNKNR